MNKEIKPVLDVRLKLGIGVVVVLLGIVMVGMFYYFDTARSELVFTGAVFGSMAAIFSAYYVAESLRLKLVMDKEKEEKDKIKSALKFSFTDDARISEIISRLDKHLKIHSRTKQEIPIDELKKYLQK